MQQGSPRRAALTLPSLAVFLLFFAGPFAYFFIISFWQVRLFKLTPDLSLDNYIGVFEEYTYPLAFTFCIALFIAVLTVVFAFALAYLIRFVAGRLGPALLMMVLLTLFGGYLVKIYAWKTILGTNGILNAALMSLGIVDEPLPWLLYNPGAVVVTLLHFLTPPRGAADLWLSEIDPRPATGSISGPWRRRLAQPARHRPAAGADRHHGGLRIGFPDLRRRLRHAAHGRWHQLADGR